MNTPRRDIMNPHWQAAVYAMTVTPIRTYADLDTFQQHANREGWLRYPDVWMWLFDTRELLNFRLKL